MKLDLSAYLDPKETLLLRRWVRGVASGRIGDPLERHGHEGTYGIEQTTLRAMSAHQPAREPGPAVILREWAAAHYVSMNQVPLRTRADFERWHARLVRSVVAAWDKKATLPLEPHAPYKIVDIFVKWIVRHLPNGSTKKERLRNWAHAPLDKKSLAFLNDAYGGILLLKGHKCSMGAIASPYSYRYHQELISALVSECGTSALMFDCYAWSEFGRRYPDPKRIAPASALKRGA